MRRALLYVMFNLSFCIYCFAQSSIYENYTIKEGLPGSTVYYTLQDSKGFMWFGTDHGLSRYDGANFINYTVRDGLPDNDVFILAEDSMERLWMICYNSQPCYLYKGVIHNASNDTLLKNINSGDMWFVNMHIDNKGRVWLLGATIYIIDKNKITALNTPDNKRCSAIGNIGQRLSVVAVGGVFYLNINHNRAQYEKILSTDTSFHHMACYRNGACYVVENITGKSRITKITSDTTFTISLNQYGISNIIENYSAIISDSVFLISIRDKGIRAFNLNLKPLPNPFPELPDNISYTHIEKDREGNTWTTTLGSGVFFIPANKVYSYQLPAKAGSSDVSAVYKFSSKVLLGLDNAEYGILDNGDIKIIKVNTSFSAGGKKMVRFCRFNKSYIAAATYYGLVLISTDNPSVYKLLDGYCIKNAAPEAEDSCLIATTNGAYRIYLRQGKLKADTLYNSRTTAIAKGPDGTIWFSTLNSLFAYRNGKPEPQNVDPILLKSRITDLVVDKDNRLWIATHQRGVYLMANNKLTGINETNGLPSDICNRFYSDGQGNVWVCAGHNAAQISVTQSDPPGFMVTTLRDFHSQLQPRGK